MCWKLHIFIHSKNKTPLVRCLCCYALYNSSQCVSFCHSSSFLMGGFTGVVDLIFAILSSIKLANIASIVFTFVTTHNSFLFRNNSASIFKTSGKINFFPCLCKSNTRLASATKLFANTLSICTGI